MKNLTRFRKITFFIFAFVLSYFFSSCKKSDDPLFYDDSFKSNFDYMFTLIGKDYDAVKQILLKQNFQCSGWEFEGSEEEFFESEHPAKDNPYYPFPVFVSFESKQRKERADYFELGIDEEKKVEEMSYITLFAGDRLKLSTLLEICDKVNNFAQWEDFEASICENYLFPYNYDYDYDDYGYDDGMYTTSYSTFIDSLRSYPTNKSMVVYMGWKKDDCYYSCMFTSERVSDIANDEIEELKESGLTIRTDAWLSTVQAVAEKKGYDDVLDSLLQRDVPQQTTMRRLPKMSSKILDVRNIKNNPFVKK